MTKVVEFITTKKEHVGKKVEVLFVVLDGELKNPKECNTQLSDWEYVTKLPFKESLEYETYYDVIYAWDETLNQGCTYWGHWNDGVIE